MYSLPRRKHRVATRSLHQEPLEERRVPALFTVSPSVPDGEPGSLRAAITDANSNDQDDVIQLAPGNHVLTRYGKNDDANLTGDLDLTEAGFSVTIRGAGANVTTIDGNELDRVLHLVAGGMLLEDLRIIRGRPHATIGNGGGVLAPRLAVDQQVELNRVIVESNQAVLGGGIYGDFSLIRNSTFHSNYAESGSAILGNGNILNTTISNNLSEFGAAVVTFFSKVDTSTITNNRTELPDRIAGLVGGDGSGSYANVSNSIISGNTDASGLPRDISQIIDQGHNMVGGVNPSPQQSPTSIFTNDPLLGPLQDNGGPTPTHQPLPGSPAINAISAGSTYPATDQRGVARPQSGLADIGAVEVIGTPPDPEQRHAADVNASGTVTIDDALWVVQELRRTGPRPVNPNPTAAPYLDVNGDGRLNISDALEVVRYLVLQRVASGGEGEAMRTFAPPQAKPLTVKYDPLALESAATDDTTNRDALLAEWSDQR